MGKNGFIGNNITVTVIDKYLKLSIGHRTRIINQSNLLLWFIFYNIVGHLFLKNLHLD